VFLKTTAQIDVMNIFTYGSLMFPVVWQKVVRHEYQSTVASVHGFRRVCVRDGDYPALVLAPRAEPIYGRLYLSVSADDVARLDSFETNEYERVTVVATVNGAALATQAYLAANVATVMPTEWDAAAFETTGLARFLATYVIKNNPPH
jgi:gamma-glutamylcyclotransferase (GGCT)/AIG2-like uncharacterized protein YtfP